MKIPKTKSVRSRLFFTICLIISCIMLVLILVNSVVLETFYIYSKTNTIKNVYERINHYYSTNNAQMDLEGELEKIATNNDFDILIKAKDNIIAYSTDKEFLAMVNKYDMVQYFNQNAEGASNIYINDNMSIRKIKGDTINYILLAATLDNGYSLYIRIPMAAIEESVKISNNLLIVIGSATILISAIVASFVSKKFTEPIRQLSEIANKMARLDFSSKYRISDVDDEINNLGKSINTMSDKLERTIKQLRYNNIELEKDIEEKSKIDEMRKQFISDVSHELKTPIALIQGYAEGLLENVNSDEESRKFYAEVILDESNKMDKLVKQLLELMKLEYGKREFTNHAFNIIELIEEVIRKCNVMIKEHDLTVEIVNTEPIIVEADDFYIDQVVTNYITNAIKFADGYIRIKVEQKEKVAHIAVYNKGKQLTEEEIEKVWGRFYKTDDSRNREKGGSGIGLSLVKAIMNNYECDYGVINKEEGVEFYFEIPLA